MKTRPTTSNTSVLSRTTGRTTVLFFAVLTALVAGCASPTPPPAAKPNIIVFYVDDLGYADVGCYGAVGVATPHIDTLARQGVRFTDAHCGAATCTPSRYSLLTGRYAFRNKAAILPGDAPLLIDTAHQTLPGMLREAGYTTAVVGKWHLGRGRGKIDWNHHIAPGANEVGFDYSFLLPATGDRVPTVYVENGNVVNLDPADPITVNYQQPLEETEPVHSDSLKMKADPQHSNTVVNGVSRIGFMKGGRRAHWVDEDFPHVFNEKALAFIDGARDKPFFLFYSFHDIHVPRMPHADFVGKSTLGPRGDAIAQVDWVVGQIVAALKQKGLADNTLIVFTSDNGPVLDDGYEDQAVQRIGNHVPGGAFRGGKYSAYEAGTRVPTIVWWPAQVKHRVSHALLTQVDLLASLAALVHAPSVQNIDSEDHLNAWLGQDTTGRRVMIEESFTLSVREGRWKYIQPFNGPMPTWMDNKKIEHGLSNTGQLYDLEHDPGEKQNLAGKLPEQAGRMQRALDAIVAGQKAR
ncbi:sulfatase family protein [Dawidia soli]|uniref:Arylsulfatase n=1 Tax=Dawidia soli TaxID=2782352 RepID=A0AAP2GKT2_9BACT|nr:arylsulfatase [Dawidia soli]MBT1689915.1 arylsulfatase [Dawidia soli]